MNYASSYVQGTDLIERRAIVIYKDNTATVYVPVGVFFDTVVDDYNENEENSTDIYVELEFLKTWVNENCDMSLEEFFPNYTHDSTVGLFYDAFGADKLIPGFEKDYEGRKLTVSRKS